MILIEALLNQLLLINEQKIIIFIINKQFQLQIIYCKGSYIKAPRFQFRYLTYRLRKNQKNLFFKKNNMQQDYTAYIISNLKLSKNSKIKLFQAYLALFIMLLKYIHFAFCKLNRQFTLLLLQIIFMTFICFYQNILKKLSNFFAQLNILIAHQQNQYLYLKNNNIYLIINLLLQILTNLNNVSKQNKKCRKQLNGKYIHKQFTIKFTQFNYSFILYG
ncbi:transmembrane protein, putative (macronuclear) [Tetrahymena thermophila SB210]|uniref:Transmembrane protein, putative n=1 Tax=Tetrahymena thermophila (strain SB210) TaxID=312017 RepID=W7XIZ4_TETTS|nr:transmembrane protein, putative [Tetrahymena thermophila SB210]EWS73739.1 transmembrane protein, putative [Tetrahymena thermophila SB210]|eukprot:XP_012653703.1 transmembrane protein, putative [Tetrahymena thermophila SB210]